jgi:hypothetical protein
MESIVRDPFLILIKDCHMRAVLVYKYLVRGEWSELLQKCSLTKIFDIVHLNIHVLENNHHELLSPVYFYLNHMTFLSLLLSCPISKKLMLLIIDLINIKFLWFLNFLLFSFIELVLRKLTSF